jgi:hypothetical protein
MITDNDDGTITIEIDWDLCLSCPASLACIGGIAKFHNVKESSKEVKMVVYVGRVLPSHALRIFETREELLQGCPGYVSQTMWLTEMYEKATKKE